MAISNLLDEIIERASRMRAAGMRVIDLDLGGDGLVSRLHVAIDPPEPTLTPAMVADAIAASVDTPAVDPLDDPETYGRKSGAPGFNFDLPDEDL